MIAPTAIEARIPISNGFTIGDMLTHDHVDDDEQETDRESAKAANDGLALKLE